MYVRWYKKFFCYERIFVAGYNRIIIIGNLTRDPEYKQLPSGQGVCNLGLASNRQYKNKQTGMMIQEVCFIDVDVFGPQAESCKQYLQKGRPVLIEGRLKFDSWETPEGQKRSKYSIVADRVVFLGSGGASDAESVEKSAMSPKAPTSTKQSGTETEDFDFPDDESPSTKKTGRSTNELAFKDEPPFSDDLPF